MILGVMVENYVKRLKNLMIMCFGVVGFLLQLVIGVLELTRIKFLFNFLLVFAK